MTILGKKQMSEEDIKLNYITPVILNGWKGHITMETKITDGRINISGNIVARSKPKFADYMLYLNDGKPIAVVEAKDNNIYGLEAISGNHYGGNHRNMSFEEEAAILAPFKARAEKGELVEISEIETAYQQAVGHSIGTSQIYYVLHRHGWRKVMPRSRHPKKASEEVIETSKKLKLPSVN